MHNKNNNTPPNEVNQSPNNTPAIIPQNENEQLPTLVIEPEKTIAVPESQLKSMVDQLKKYRQKEEKIKSVALQAGVAFGLVDSKTGKLITPPEGTTQTSMIIRALTDKISVTKLMFNPDKELEKLSVQFSFFSELGTIFEDFANGQ